METTALRVVGSIALLSAISFSATAASVTLNYTGDNDVVAWWVAKTGAPPLSAADIVASDTISKPTDWGSVASATFDLAPGQYAVFFEVRNTNTDHNGADTTPTIGLPNPAAFIASISGPGVTGAGGYTTYTTWPGWSFINTTGFSATGSNENNLVTVYNSVPATDALFLLGANGSSPWGTFNTIDPLAQFIWGNTDGVKGSLSSQASRGIFYTVVDVAPVPVPAAVWLLGSAIVGFAGFGRRKSAST